MVVGSDDTGARSSNICLYAATGIHPAPMARPLSRGLRDWGCRTLDFIRLWGSILHRWPKSLRDWGCHTLDFIRLGGSILRRWRGPSPRAYGFWGVHIGFQDATRIHLAPIVWLPSKGLRDLEWLIFAFILLRVNFQTLN